MNCTFTQLLRSSLVNNKTQAMVASDLGMSEYIIDAKNRTLEDGGPLPTKLLADLLEGRFHLARSTT